MIIKILISLLIFIIICLPCAVLSIPMVAILLLTAWDGRSTIFGNSKHGRGADRGVSGYWHEFLWLVYRNPVNNLLTHTLAIPGQLYFLCGDPDIGDAVKGGFYSVTMGWAWEFYWIAPYRFFGKRCIRVRIGWKIFHNEGSAAYVFTVNPFKPYSGV